MDKIYIAALTPNEMTAELSNVILRRRMQIWLEILSDLSLAWIDRA
jgi:hypothetical protein